MTSGNSTQCARQGSEQSESKATTNIEVTLHHSLSSILSCACVHACRCATAGVGVAACCVWVCVHVSPADSENASSCLNTEEISSQSSGKTSKSLEPKCLAKFSNAFCTPLNCTSFSYRGDRCCEEQVQLKHYVYSQAYVLHLKQTHVCHTMNTFHAIAKMAAYIYTYVSYLIHSISLCCAPSATITAWELQSGGIRYICDGTRKVRGRTRVEQSLLTVCSGCNYLP